MSSAATYYPLTVIGNIIVFLRFCSDGQPFPSDGWNME